MAVKKPITLRQVLPPTSARRAIIHQSKRVAIKKTTLQKPKPAVKKVAATLQKETAQPKSKLPQFKRKLGLATKLRNSVARWLRKQRFTTAVELATHKQKVRPQWHRWLTAPFEPFYLSFRYFPIHFVIAFLLSGIVFAGTYYTHELIFKDLPEVTELTTKEPAVSSQILDRNGTVLYKVYQDENRTPVSLEKISPYLLNATIAIEDKDFYQHHGFSVAGIGRAAFAFIQQKGEVTQGGSTLTQQLVKNRLLSNERTFQRKIKELILSVLVEGVYEKDEILTMYLNQVAYGGSTYGIQAAAERYFGKSAQDLTLAESTLLAGLPAAPSVYTPFGAYPELARERQKEVIRRMVDDGYITQAEADEAAATELSFKADNTDILAPHFVMYVRGLLAEQYGEEALATQGLQVRTTLDLPLHNSSQKIVTDEVDSLRRLNITNGAALVTNPKTGEVLSMVGSTNYFDFAHDGQVNIPLRSRQPGSSIKPLTYAMAMEKGYSTTTRIDDSPITYKVASSPPYSPKNYDGKYHGQVTVKESLGSSYNIPAVKTLEYVGVDAFISKAEKMGISTWKDRKRFGLSLTLGGGEVKMVDLVVAYSSFANEGISTPLNPILEVKNYKGEVLYRNSCVLDGTGCPGKKSLDGRVAYLISRILSDNTARIPAFGPQSALVIPGQEVAVKTGTTNNMRDNWTVGYTSDRLVSVWVGNNNNTPMSYVASGVTGASPIWNKIIRSVLDSNSPHRFAVPDGLLRMSSCTTGNTNCSGCKQVATEYYIPGTEPHSPCGYTQTTREVTTPSTQATL